MNLQRLKIFSKNMFGILQGIAQKQTSSRIWQPFLLGNFYFYFAFSIYTVFNI